MAGRSEKTVAAYRLDVHGFLEFLQGYEGEALGVSAIARARHAHDAGVDWRMNGGVV